MKSFDYWKIPLSGIFIAVLMLVSASGIAQFVPVGTPSGTNNISTEYPSPYGNYYWGSRQQFLYPASELAAAGLAAGDITAIQFDVIDTDLSQPHENYQISIGQTATASLAGWESGLASVYGPVTQAPTVGLNTFTFSSPFGWDGTSNIVIEICHSNSSFTDNCHVEWTEPLGYTGSYTYRADGTFETNGGCSTTLNSQTAFGVNPNRRPMTNFEGTLASCPPPLDILVDNITENSADLSWTDTGGDVYIEYGEASFSPGTDATAGGGTVLGPFTGGSYTLGGLNPQTDYEVYFREECTPGTWSLNSSESFSTSCSIFPAPFFEDFEGVTATNTEDFPNCWETLGTKPWYVRNSSFTGTPNPYGDLSTLELTDHTTGSGSYIWVDGSSPNFTPDDGSAPNNEVITPPIDISTLTTPYVSFWVGSYYTGTSGDNELKLYAWDGAAWELLTTYNDNTQNNWVEVNAVVPGTIPTVTQFRLVVWSVSGSSFYNDILVDDFSVAEAPTCLAPENLSVDGLTSGSADVSWTCTGCTGSYYVEYGAPGFTPGADENAGTGTVIGPIAGLSTTIPGLSPSTDYEFVVRQDCGSEFSFNSSTESFTTPCVAVSAPWTEDFETFSPGTAVPVCWENPGPDFWTVNEVGGYDVGTSIGGSDHTTGTGNWLLADGSDGFPVDDGLTAASIELITPQIDISGLSVPYFSMWVGKYNISTPGQNDLKAYAWDGSSWVEFISYSDVSNPSWTEVASALPAGLPSVTQIRLVVWNITANAFNDDVMIDDLSLDEAPACLTPGNLSADAVTSNSADVSWTCTGCTGQFYVEYGAPGFTPGADENAGTGTVVGPIAGLSTTIPGLAANTTYDVYVRQDCGAIDGFSENSSFVQITTACTAVSSFPFSETFENASATQACWTNIQEVGTGNWTFQTGSSGGTVTSAYEGTLNARFISQSGDNNPITKLVSPILDMSAFLSAELDFYFAQEVWAGDQNTMGVYYRLSPGDPWVLLAEYTESVAAWTNATLFIPDASATMQIAFEGRNNWGRANVVDLVTVSGLNCAPPLATAIEVPDCGNDQFFIDVNVTSLGSDGSFDLITDVNGVEANITATGTEQIGPFPNGTEVNITLDHSDPDCVAELAPVAFFCPPPNDDCANATPLALNNADDCMGAAVGAYTTAATEDGPTGTCLIAGLPDVWFSFSTGSSPYVEWEVTFGTMESIGVEIWDECGGSSLYCEGDILTDFVTLEANSDYLFRVLSVSGFEGTFDICLEAGPDSPGDSCDPQFSASAGETIAEPPLPCDEAQGSAGYPLDPGCESSVCAQDGFCCSNTWDTICAGIAETDPNCSGCLDVSNFATTTESTLDVTGPFPNGDIITDLDLVVTIQHADISELVIELESPCGTMVTIQSEECAGGANMDAYFDDTASDSFTEFCNLRIGEVQPLEGLLAFNNQPIEGIWTLHVTDLVSGNVGTITDWCLVPTLDDGCPPPQVVVTDYTDNTITIDSDPNSCYDPSNYDSYDVQWTGGGSATGVSLPYEITGLAPGTLYIVDVFSNCTVGGSSAPASGGVAQTTLNCAPEDICTYELTLSNTDGTGWGDAFARVDNGWTSTDYFMDESLETQSWTIQACPGNPISLEVVNGGNGALDNNFTISFVNSDDVEVFFDAGPPETVLYNQADGCPDCAPAINLELTRLAADLVELNWTNVELPANVDDIQVIVLIEDFFGSTEIANETFASGTTSASVVLDGSYPFTDVTVQVVTNCSNEGGALGQVLTTLPGCDAASQCEYVFDMSSTDDGWVNSGLQALVDGSISIDVVLESGTSGSQTIYACPDGTIDVTAEVEEGSGIPDDTCINTAQWPSGTVTVPNTGAVTQITTCNFGGEFSSLNLGTAGQYEFTSSVSGDYFTLTDASNNVIAAGPNPLTASIPSGGTYRLHINTNSSCGTDSNCRTTTAQYIGAGAAGCDSYTFSLVLNPSTDNVTLVSETDFCDFENGDLVYSGSTCPSCFTPIDVVVSDVADLDADFEWFSNNPAGTDYTVYVGLPGFTPGVDEVASATGTTAATGAQGPVTVSGLDDDTTYEVIIVEDCGTEESDATLPVPFTTLISGDVCSSAIPLTVQAGGGCPAGSTTNSFAGLSDSGDDISCLDFVPFPAPIDAYYTFNSGSLDAISLYVTMTAADYLIVDIYDGCSGEAIFCENGFGSPSIIEVDPNTDYIVRVITSENNSGDHSICVSPPSGCTDPAALNYNELAEFDDGTCYSCGDATTLTVEANGACPANEVAQDMTGADNSLGNFIECVGATVPLLDEFYTFNSGTSTGVEITVSLGTMGFQAIEVYQECLGDAIFCNADGTGGTFGPIGVQPNTDYTVRISTIAGQEGTYGICVQDAVPPSGCTDPNAVNFDPIAGVDDGSCILCAAGENGVVLDMEDSFGDGWNGNTYTITDLSDPFNPVVVETGDLDSATDGDTDNFGTDYFCLPDGCYEITVGGGSFTGEVSWTLNGVDGGPIDGGAPETVQFTINSTCPVLGCTDPNALNYDEDATIDDGSCIIGDCNDPATPFTYCYGNSENSSFNIAPFVPGDDIIVIFEQGSLESSSFDTFTVYDGFDDTAPILYQNPAATTQLDGAILESTLGNGLYITLSTDGSVSCQSTGTYNEIIADIFCGSIVTPGCTDPNAVNYDPAADFDDGSCVLPPANDDCDDAQTLTPVQYPNTQNALGTLSGASQDGSSACVGTNGSDVFYTFNVPLENHYWVNLNPFGGFAGVVEVLDACDGTVVACENAPASAPFCDVSQATAGFPSDPGCEASVCAGDAFCCNTSWDGVCAGDAAVDPNCVNCLSTAPAGSGPVSIFIQNLPAGDYIVRVRDYYGNSYLDNTGQFLVNVQYFPFAGVQDNPNSFLYACNQSGFQLEDFVGATPQSGQGALDYQWYIYEEGGTFSNQWQRGEPNYVSRCFWLEMDYGFTYNVFVRILLDVPGVGPVWGVYPYLDSDPHAVGASACTITTATNVTPTELRPNYTPTNANGDLYAMCDFAIAYNVAESENFRWRFDPDTDPNNGNEIFYTRGVGNPSVRLSWVNGLLPGGIYNVAVEVMVEGQWSGFSTVLPIELALPPNNVVIRPQFCGGTYSPNDYILSESVCEADLYQFRFTPVGGGTPSFRNSGNYVCFMSAANPPLTPGDYDVQVKVTQNGVPGDWGPACTITIAGPQGQGGNETPTLRDIESTSTATLFPNPNAGSEVRVELSGLGDGNHEVNVNIYDVYGKLISTDGFGHEGSEMSRLIRFDEDLATGMYMVHVFVDGEQFTVERLVVK